jgi:pyruvate/2-oxoglutarate dehydrogenase complex dihydrolipoamide acyltransferase (E2) component
LACELAVNLDGVAGTGPHGRVTRVDVVHAAAQAPAPRGRTTGATPVTCVVEVDVTRIADADRSLLAAVVHAVAQALRVSAASPARIGVAVDTSRGIVVPTIADATDLNLSGLSRRLGELERRGREQALTPEELGTSAVTVTNHTGLGIAFEVPALASGSLAALGIGAAVERPVVVRPRHGQSAIAIRTVAFVAMTYDNLVWDRATAARFLGAVKERVEAHRDEGEF